MQVQARGIIVLFPFMAQGHLNPFTDLAYLFASRAPDLTITIVSTPGNVLNLRPLFESTPSITLAELPFRSSDLGLPPNIEHTRTLSRAAISQLYNASESLLPAFHRLISSVVSNSNGPPLLAIVSDMFLAWSVEVANSFRVFHAVLYTSGPYAMSIYNSIWTHLPHRLTCADDLTLPDLPGITIHRSQLSNNMKAATGDCASAVFVRRQAEYCRRTDGTLWNTVDVLEKTSLVDWARSTGKPVWAIGPLALMSPAAGDRGGHELGASVLTCAEWLNLHALDSVVFVAFGSQSSIGQPQMMELAEGLELSGKPFVWALRPPIGFDAAGEFKDEFLPVGFEDRMREKKQGLLIRKWAPQPEILRHPSTGAFVSHCGWNSALESLSYGVPIIGWPLASEQFYNSKLLVEELGVCIEMARGVDEVVRRENVTSVVKEILEGERGREVRQKAQRLSEEMKRAVKEVNGLKGSSLRSVDEFIETVKARA